MGVPGFGQLGIDGAVNPLFHLRRRFIGKGQYQQAVRVELFPRQDSDDPAGQHRSLARAGAGGDRHVAPVIGGQVLKDGRVKTSHSSNSITIRGRSKRNPRRIRLWPPGAVVYRCVSHENHD